MCLEANVKVTQGTGWKVVYDYDGQVWGPYLQQTGQHHPYNTWIRDTQRDTLYAEDSTWTPYPCGFHVFKHKKDAKVWARSGKKLVKVSYRGVLATGMQRVTSGENPQWAKVVVALEIFVERN